MEGSRFLPPTCEYHGRPTKRETCRRCNAAYMRTYLRGRRVLAPELTIWQRAHRRAAGKGVPFGISVKAVSIPAKCPVLGIPILLGERRSENSPSLDRIVPDLGYVAGNVRVISDKANRLKGDRNLEQLREKAISSQSFRDEYRLLADYVERETRLREFHAGLRAIDLPDSKVNQIQDLFYRVLWEKPLLDGGRFVGTQTRTKQLTSEMIEDEFGLTKKQVRMLRRLAGFPNPRRKLHGFIFERTSVEEWIAAQPNPADPAAVIRRQPGARRRNVRSRRTAELLAKYDAQW